MAATTTKIFQLRPKPLPTHTHTPTPASVYFFSSSQSSSSTPDSDSNPTPEPPPKPRSSLFSDIKATLKQSQQQTYPQSQRPPRKSFSFGSSSPPHNNTALDLEQIRRNISEFRIRTVPPPPPPSSNAFGSSPVPPDSTEPISLGKLYERNVASKSEGPITDEPKSFGMLYQDIREKLRNIKPTVNRNDKNVRLNKPLSPSYTRESLKSVLSDQSKKPSPTVIGGGDSLPLSVFGPEMREEDGDGSGREMSWRFWKIYDHKELGEKLRLLRPEKKGDKKDWFSLEELNQRLVKLREMEERDYKSRRLGAVHIGKLGLEKMMEDEAAKKKAMFTLDALRYPGRTPGYMLSPPKEELVEKYFHLDNMSASEKLKLELNKVRDEFKMSESDCGSARVQVAQLTTKIRHLSEVLHQKDKHSRKGLQAMVERRKKLLKYMRRTDWDSYCFVLSKLGLRDNPGYKH